MRPCILLGSHRTDDEYDGRVSSDQAPRVNYIELARKVGGVIPLHPLLGSPLLSGIRRVERRLSLDLSMALWAAQHAEKYSVIV